MARPSAWKARACRMSALRNIVPISRSNRLIAWSVRLAARSEGDGDQGGMPALALVTRDMLQVHAPADRKYLLAGPGGLRTIQRLRHDDNRGRDDRPRGARD